MELQAAYLKNEFLVLLPQALFASAGPEIRHCCEDCAFVSCLS